MGGRQEPTRAGRPPGLRTGIFGSGRGPRFLRSVFRRLRFLDLRTICVLERTPTAATAVAGPPGWAVPGAATRSMAADTGRKPCYRPEVPRSGGPGIRPPRPARFPGAPTTPVSAHRALAHRAGSISKRHLCFPHVECFGPLFFFAGCSKRRIHSIYEHLLNIILQRIRAYVNNPCGNPIPPPRREKELLASSGN